MPAGRCAKVLGYSTFQCCTACLGSTLQRCWKAISRPVPFVELGIQQIEKNSMYTGKLAWTRAGNVWSFRQATNFQHPYYQKKVITESFGLRNQEQVKITVKLVNLSWHFDWYSTENGFQNQSGTTRIHNDAAMACDHWMKTGFWQAVSQSLISLLFSQCIFAASWYYSCIIPGSQTG